tara:strand:+ start:1891 stop:2541 length:651 start_codon:yes stop_codon:yes gene_type:complete
MENSKLAVSNKPSLETLKEGDTLMVSIRKVYHTKGDASKGYKASIELAQFIENPDRPTSAISMLNEGDERFASKKAQHAYQPVSAQVAFKNNWISEESFEALTPSVGIPIGDQVEGKHFVIVNKLNPTFDGKRLKVQILESTETNSQAARAKINPRTGVTVTHMGKPVYRTAQVAFEGNSDSRFLASDNTIARLSGDSASDLAEGTKKSILGALNK